jgi:two-component system NtrC family sensor kinase
MTEYRTGSNQGQAAGAEAEGRSSGPARQPRILDELARRYEALKAANELNESIIEGISYALVVLDGDLRVVRCNQQFRDTFQPVGADGRALLQEPGVKVPLADVFPDGRLDAIIREGISAGQAIREVEFSCAIGGEERHFLLAVSRMRCSAFQGGILVMFDEVTEWKRRQHQVMEASRLVSIGEMAAGIAHEINNPLAAVMGFAQLVLRRDLDPMVRKDVEKVLTEAKRASKIVANLQSFARRYKPRKEPVSVADLVQKALDFRAYELQVSNIHVVTRFDPATPMIMSDPHQLDQVFLNLVINAEYFMSTAHGGGTLNVGVGRAGDRVRVSLADDGPGIAPDVMPKIFDPFFTTKEVGKGSGLGLSICYGIVHEHGGTIYAESAPGQGATFFVELPVGDVPAAGAEGGQPIASAASVGKMRVLIVDDEPAVAEFVARTLAEFGHEVEIIEAGHDITQTTDLSRYDLIILDMKMPGFGGDALFERIKQQSPDIASRVLFITGDTTNPATRDFINQTANQVLTKPFTIEELALAVRKVALRRSLSDGG